MPKRDSRIHFSRKDNPWMLCDHAVFKIVDIRFSWWWFYEGFLRAHLHHFRKFKNGYFWTKRSDLPRMWTRPWCGPMRPSERPKGSFSALVAWGPHQGRIHFWIPDKSLTTRNIHIRTFGKKVEKIENENPENYRSCVCPEFSNSKNSGQTQER